MGVTLRYDMFADQVNITGLPGFGRVFDDAAARRLRLQIDQRFKIGVPKEMFWDVVLDAARLNEFHPVRDYLNALTWDGVPRIAKWLTTYGGAEATDYTCAVGALMLLAAVRRVRKPGSKFDEMLVLENEVQGTNKSSALALLAVKDEWFSDDIPHKLHGKQVIETVRGRWIIEAPELQNIRRDDIQPVKTFLAKRYDRGRLVYDRLMSDVPRQCVFVGTIDQTEYLRDTAGNRRWWPVRVVRFNLEALKRDRDQLWADAAALEAAGASIRLDEKLWPTATLEQQARLTHDPWHETLLAELGDKAADASAQRGEKIASASVWTILNITGAQQTQDQSQRVGKAMRELGWRRKNTASTVKTGGKLVTGYVRGEAPWTVIKAERRFDKDTGQHELLVYATSDKDTEDTITGKKPQTEHVQGNLPLKKPIDYGHCDPKLDPPGCDDPFA
jgi:predicted P-loop ATPase